MQAFPKDDLVGFRMELRDWIDQNKPSGLSELTDWTHYPFSRTRHLIMRAAMASPLYKDWESRLLAERLICANWPEDVGGRGLTAAELAILSEEFMHAQVPVIHRGGGEILVGPSVIVHGTPEQKAYFLPRIVDGTDIYCQGFSEPNHGSDLAAVETKGVVDGDEITISGQKVWTSQDPASTNMIFILCRTDDSQPRHRGLSYVLVPFRNNGIDVRPIRQMTGGASFCEEFIDGARAPLFNVIGGLGNGWRVAMTTLGNERGGGATVMHLQHERQFWDLVADVKRLGKDKDPYVRQQLAWAYEQVQIIRIGGKQLMAALTEGRPVGRGVVGSKLRNSEFHKKFAAMAMNILGPEGLIRPPGEDYDVSTWQEVFLHSPAGTIVAGTSQIQRNIISERVLGMPKEPSSAASKAS